MKLFFWIAIFLTFIKTEAFAQKQTRNNIYMEALGFAGHYSVNYERFQPLFHKRLLLLGFNAGFCLEQYKLSKGYAIPLGLKVCVGTRNIFGEFGGDFLFVREGSPDFFHGGWRNPINSKFRFLHAGIRYQPSKKGLFIRGFIYPFNIQGVNNLVLYYYGKPDYYVLRDQGKKFVWWGGLDVGYSF